jgi:hypothetical protein
MISRCVVVCQECGGRGWLHQIVHDHISPEGARRDTPCRACNLTGKVGPVNAHGLEPGPGR